MCFTKNCLKLLLLHRLMDLKAFAVVTSECPSEQSQAVNMGKIPPETESAGWILVPILDIR